MAKRTDNSGAVVAALFAAFSKLPTKVKIGLVVLVLVVGGIAWAAGAFRQSPPEATKPHDDPSPGLVADGHEGLDQPEVLLRGGRRDLEHLGWIGQAVDFVEHNPAPP